MTEDIQNELNGFIDEPNEEKDKKQQRKKIFAVMEFRTELEMGISQEPNKWINTKNTIFSDGAKALIYYSNTPCPASQIVDGFSAEELLQNMEDMIQNYKDQKWLEENLYPYL